MLYLVDFVDYNFFDLREFKIILKEIKNETPDFKLLEGLLEGTIEADVENIKLAEGNLQALVYSFALLAELEAPLIEALDLINEVKKNTLDKTIGYQNFFIERSIDSQS